jgi:hypothetical protein
LFAKTQESSAGAFDELRTLSGNWEGTVAWTGKTASKVSAHYYITGNGSAVVEDLSNGISVYHLDGADLRMTHYCAAQNQPRLRASSFGRRQQRHPLFVRGHYQLAFAERRPR